VAYNTSVNKNSWTFLSIDKLMKIKSPFIFLLSTWWEIAYRTKRFNDLISHATYIFKPHLISFIYSHFVQFDYCRQQNFGLSAITDCARVYIGNLKKYYHYFNHGIIIKMDTTITMIKFVSYKWDSRQIIKTMESQWCQISGTEQQI
jgi:hypothetical protein